ncbi:MAG: hypothetical protein ACQPRJ_03645 [Solitalea-like symbiont of Acarus siro]
MLFIKNCKLTFIVLSLLLTIVIIACKKDSNKIDQGGQKLECYEINGCKNVIYSLQLDSSENNNNYLDINNKKVVSDKEHWDFKMSGIYTSNINANTSIKGRLNFIDIEFDKVTTDAVLEKFGDKGTFNSKFINLKDFGMHHFLGEEEGWANYDISTHIVKPLPDRTLLLITADPTNSTKHKLLKIKIMSMYEGCILKPTIADKKKVPYLTSRFEALNIDIDNLITD